MSANRRHASTNITGIVAAMVVAALIMSWLFGTFGHWLLVVPGLIVGVWAAQKIR
jgi:hypothetical protein